MQIKEIEELIGQLQRRAEAHAYYAARLKSDNPGQAAHRVPASEYAKAAAVLTFLLEQTQWREIESAPTDGTRILGAVAGNHADQVEVIFNAKGTGWFNQSSEMSMWKAFPPTHWMPLPRPPLPEEANG